ncbi:MAG: dicarboxylate/amino acid:cation symporter [Gorillibacterium sp.]|nr:dicarboxylate/amino acid:cation symporter [Gorillibacterium sp.]
MVTFLEYRWMHIWSLVAAFGVIGILYVLARLKLGFSIRVLFAMVVGLLLGTFFGRYALEVNIGIFGQVYISLTRMLVMPLILTTIISGIMNMHRHFRALRKMILQTLALFLTTTSVAALIGMLAAVVIDPGVGIAQSDATEGIDIPTLSKVILDLIPANPIVELASGRLMPIILFSIIIVIAAARETAHKPREAAQFTTFFDILSRVTLRLTSLIIYLTPYGVFGLAVAMGARYGTIPIRPLGGFILTIYIACALHLIIVLAGLILWSVRLNPLHLFIRMLPVMLTAFITRSSYATLPIQLLTLIKNVRISSRVASLTTSIGTAINLNGSCGIYPAVVALFVARVYKIDLGIVQYIEIAVIAAGITLAIAGASRPAPIAAMIMLTVLGLPAESLGLVLGVEAIVDMALTVVNVAGTAVSTLVVANLHGEFNRNEYLKVNRDCEVGSIDNTVNTRHPWY